MYLRLRGENPFMSGKALRKSCASRSMTLAPPALFGLPRQNVLSDLPVQQHQFAIKRQCGALLGVVNAAYGSVNLSP